MEQNNASQQQIEDNLSEKDRSNMEFLQGVNEELKGRGLSHWIFAELDGTEGVSSQLIQYNWCPANGSKDLIMTGVNREFAQHHYGVLANIVMGIFGSNITRSTNQTATAEEIFEGMKYFANCYFNNINLDSNK